jgi:hypothetical protein
MIYCASKEIEMMKTLCTVLFLAILCSTIPLASSCTEEEKKELPYGEVTFWGPRSMFIYKDEKNVRVDAEGKMADELYELIELEVHVVNTGADGMCTFHAACNLNTLGRNQGAQNISLKKDETGKLIFEFWVNLWDESEALRIGTWRTEAFTVQAVNLGDILD